MEKIRKIIKEELHAILEIEKITNELAPYCMKRISSEKNYAIQYKQKTAGTSFTVQELNLSHSAFVNFLIINVEFKKEADNKEINKVGGSYIEESIDQEIVNGIIKYNGEIKLKLYNWDYNTDLTHQIKNVLDHELHHFFDDIITFNKKKTTKFLNSVNRMTIDISQKLLEKYPELKDFTEIFYLNLSKERNARIQAVNFEAKKYKDQTLDVIIEKLGKFAPFKDFQRMDKFDVNKLNYIPIEDRKKFIELFNISLNYNRKKFNISAEEINYPKEPDKFFGFWKEQFKKNSQKLFKDSISIAKKMANSPIKENWNYKFDDDLSLKSMEILFNYHYRSTKMEINKSNDDRIKYYTKVL